MKKFLRVFYSQIFNSFFPILIVAILINLKNKSDVAPIFLMLNFANVYLLFSDYSANVNFLKNAIAAGGIHETTAPSIIKDIEHYIGIKTIVFVLGFIAWIAMCFFIPLLHQNMVASICCYAFIISYNLNFYWVYMSSSKEYLFIISNFCVRLSLLLWLLFFIHFHFNLSYVMAFVGVGNALMAILFFKNFCRLHKLDIHFNPTTIKESVSVIKKDAPLVINSFLLMSPNTCATFFIGYVKNTELILVYGLAEKIFLACRAMLSVFVSSIYPVFCSKEGVSRSKAFKIFGGFYACITIACASIYFISPYLLHYFHLPATSNRTFYTCLFYLLATIVAISLNVPPFIWILLKHQLNTAFATVVLFITAMMVIGEFVFSTSYFNGVISVTQSLLIAESLVVVAFLVIYFTKRKGVNNSYQLTATTI